MTTKSNFIAKRKPVSTSQEIERRATPWQVRDKRPFTPDTALGPSPRIGPTIAESSAPRYV
jgi:hypothetical protein